MPQYAAYQWNDRLHLWERRTNFRKAKHRVVTDAFRLKLKEYKIIDPTSLRQIDKFVGRPHNSK